MRNWILTVLGALLSVVLVPLCAVLALVGRFREKTVIGIGPDPIISHGYHKKALEKRGYEVVTFVTHTYFITNRFDLNFSQGESNSLVHRLIAALRAYLWVVLNCRGLYLYFSGGPLGVFPVVAAVEPVLYKLAGVKTLVMPYGSDVQELSRSGNLLFKDAVGRDYPAFRHQRRIVENRIDRWTRYADVVISGVEWVDYMYHWDYIQVGHFSIDLEYIDGVRAGVGADSDPDGAAGEAPAGSADRPFRVLHAPNHRAIKGTAYLIDAIDGLRADGVNIELVLIEKMPNEEFLALVADCDVVVDQLVIGWYAMFAIEGMAMSKPVVCYVRDDLKQFYEDVGALQKGDLPLIDACPGDIAEVLRELSEMPREELDAMGTAGREYVEKYHSLEVIGGFFAGVNQRMGLLPTGEIEAPLTAENN